MNNDLDSHHFLSLPRPDPIQPAPSLAPPDTTTLAAHDFDVDNRTGFMPPHPPLKRLPPQWERWERVLEDAQRVRVSLGGGDAGDKWRRSVREMPILATKPLRQSELYLRRAHHVLTWILHFYVHSVPLYDAKHTQTIIVPRALSLPLLRVCTQLQLPPVLTYSDSVLYNWEFATHNEGEQDRIPTFNTPLKCLTLFTGTLTEQEFYLLSARIELRGVRALDLMRATMDEVFVGDDIAIRRITGFLEKLKDVVGGMTEEFKGIQSRGCDPDVFYREVRPWMNGTGKKRWVFEGLDDGVDEERDEPVYQPEELSGPSAGQSSIVHALDIFLGVDKWSHAVSSSSSTGTDTGGPPTDKSKPTFLTRMQRYMPRHHRHFLQHLSANPRPLRHLITSSSSSSGSHPELVEAYNGVVGALKEFRDAHMVAVALYILGPARRAKESGGGGGGGGGEDVRGTGGTDVVRFLKSVRDETGAAAVFIT
ncbi:hypothetical protein AX15_000566 [Amanita polypyramis BW_CC]|nr:hypothetical protein AX15_000566 [Amanita polypyramis BW_CC]